MLYGPDGKPFPTTRVAPQVGEHRSAKLVGTFTLPADFPAAKLNDRDYVMRTFIRPWVTLQERQGWKLQSNVMIEQDQIPEIGDMFKGTTDTLRYRYNMTAMFSRPAVKVTLTDIPDSVAEKLDANRFTVETT